MIILTKAELNTINYLAKKEIKFILDKENIVCTDGNIMFVFKHLFEIDQQIKIEIKDLISNFNLVDFKLLKDNNKIQFIYENGITILYDYTQNNLNYQKVIPESFNNIGATFDIKYLSIIDKLYKSYKNKKYYHILYNGENPAKVILSDKSFVILAPLIFKN